MQEYESLNFELASDCPVRFMRETFSQQEIALLEVDATLIPGMRAETGQHSDTGGHYGNVPKLTALNLYVMAKVARDAGVPIGTGPSDPDVEAFYGSRYARTFVPSRDVEAWEDRLGDRTLLTSQGFEKAIFELSQVGFEPAGYGTQKHGRFNAGYLLNHQVLYVMGRHQPVSNYVQRDLGSMPSIYTINPNAQLDGSVTKYFDSLSGRRPGAQGGDGRNEKACLVTYVAAQRRLALVCVPGNGGALLFVLCRVQGTCGLRWLCSRLQSGREHSRYMGPL
jgi:hypothetical protein